MAIEPGKLTLADMPGYDPVAHGRPAGLPPGQPSHWEDTWARAVARSNARGGTPAAGLYVPSEVCWFDAAISPRHEKKPDQETVERYRVAKESLPPIVVRVRLNPDNATQTLEVQDGRTRLKAAENWTDEHILARVVVQNDLDFRLGAFEANVGHGRHYSLEEKREGLRLELELRPGQSDPVYARLTGLSTDTVSKLRKRWGASQSPSDGSYVHSDVTENRIPEEAATRTVEGLDGKRYTVKNRQSPVTQAQPKTFDPGPEADRHEDEPPAAEAGELEGHDEDEEPSQPKTTARAADGDAPLEGSGVSRGKRSPNLEWRYTFRAPAVDGRAADGEDFQDTAVRLIDQIADDMAYQVWPGQLYAHFNEPFIQRGIVAALHVAYPTDDAGNHPLRPEDLGDLVAWLRDQAASIERDILKGGRS
jgi:hypothetical protein